MMFVPPESSNAHWIDGRISHSGLQSAQRHAIVQWFQRHVSVKTVALLFQRDRRRPGILRLPYHGNVWASGYLQLSSEDFVFQFKYLQYTVLQAENFASSSFRRKPPVREPVIRRLQRRQLHRCRHVRSRHHRHLRRRHRRALSEKQFIRRTSRIPPFFTLPHTVLTLFGYRVASACRSSLSGFDSFASTSSMASPLSRLSGSSSARNTLFRRTR